MTTCPPAPVPRWAYLACAAPVLGIFAVYAVTLDRYPLPYQDESFYPAPAVSAVEGGPFVHATRSDAPFGDWVWGYHGPFYPRLLVPLFRAFGVSLRVARLPQFVAAHAAVLLLCGVLLARRRTWSAVVLALAWVGDRTQQEVLYARMEGLCLLCLAVGFWGLLTDRRAGRAVAGAALTAGCGFHPIALFFPVGGMLWCAGRGWRAAAAYAAGGGLALAALVLALLPDPVAAVVQFRWHAGLYVTNRQSLAEQVAQLWQILQWSRYWAVATVVVAAGLAAGFAAVVARDRRRAAGDPVPRLAALFAGCGLLGFVVMARCAFPYNLVVLTVWPVVGVASALESADARGRAALWVAAALLLAGWVPSAAWNALRTREPLVWGRLMDSGPTVESLRRAIPEGQTVAVDKYVGLFGWSLERPAVLLPWHQGGQRPPAPWWLLLSDAEYERCEQLAPEERDRRPVILRTTLYRPECPLNQELYLLGPAPSTRPPAQ